MIARALLSVLAIWANRNRHRLRTDEEGRRRMSEQWRGHYARCLECENRCASGEPCRCCLAAEVEVLRAQVQRVRDVLGDVGNVYAPPVVFVATILTALDGGATNE